MSRQNSQNEYSIETDVGVATFIGTLARYAIGIEIVAKIFGLPELRTNPRTRELRLDFNRSARAFVYPQVVMDEISRDDQSRIEARYVLWSDNRRTIKHIRYHLEVAAMASNSAEQDDPDLGYSELLRARDCARTRVEKLTEIFPESLEEWRNTAYDEKAADYPARSLRSDADFVNSEVRSNPNNLGLIARLYSLEFAAAVIVPTQESIDRIQSRAQFEKENLPHFESVAALAPAKQFMQRLHVI